jgi:hypothetical protein
MWLDLPPLFITQPKQVAPHLLLCSESESLAEANQQPIQPATLLLGFHPNKTVSARQASPRNAAHL